MSALPTVKVELAFGSGFTDTAASRTWTDVTSYVSGASGIGITYGRGDEQQQPTPNTLNLTFENVLGDFTPGYASSTFYPNVVKGVPIRVTFTYSAASVRYVGYVNEWPVQWPTGSNLFATASITAASRRARLAQSAQFTQSAIRRAYLATSPDAYWPMDEDTDVTDNTGRQAFRDITNPIISASLSGDRQAIGSFYAGDAFAPVVRDGTSGPTDEVSLVRLDNIPDVGWLGFRPHYIGVGGGIKLNASLGMTAECVARIEPSGVGLTTSYFVSLINLFSADLGRAVFLYATSQDLGSPEVSCEMMYRDPFTHAVVEDQYDYSSQPTTVDGQIHHYAFTLNSAGTQGRFYLDGALVKTLNFGTAVYRDLFTDIAFAADTYNATAWVGHGAVHNRALTGAEIATRAAQATAASESISERMIRLGGYLGVPSAEINAETSIAVPLGPQPELGQTAASILDAVATSVNGVLYDGRDGTLNMQARNHRYGAATAVTLSTSGQEIEADLTLQYDDRYLINSVEVSRAGSDQSAPLSLSDATSVAEYGVYSQSYTLATSSDDEAEAFGYDVLYRYAQPRVRVTAVTVDLVDLSSSQRTLVLGLDIGSKLTLSGLPAQAGASSLDLFIEGYSESYSTTGTHSITFNTTPGTGYPSLAFVGTAVVGSASVVY